MKRDNLFIAVGILSILLLVFLTGCGADTLKSSQHSPQEETIAEEESSADTAQEDSAEGGSDIEPAEGEADAEPTENPETNCSTLNPHPMAEGIAEQYEISYDQVMTWYCDGYAFSDILLALQTQELVDLTTEELLSMIEDSTWDEIWEELGVNPN
jgi:hypothetical protein